jgi:hypothetical protein
LAKGGLDSFVETFAQGSAFVLRMNISAKNTALRQAANRYLQQKKSTIWMHILFNSKVIAASAIVVMWFIFGTMMYMRGSKSREELKVIQGDLESYEIITIPASRRMIDILTFSLSGQEEKTALFLNSREDYKPFIDKFQTDQTIKIMYDASGVIDASGYNLHIYQIDYGAETLLDYTDKTSTDKRVAKIIFIIGLIFALPALYIFRQEKRISSR